MCQALVVVDGDEFIGRGRELHGQMRGGDDSAKGVAGRTAQEDVVGCWRVDDKEADWNGFGLGAIAENGVEVDVTAGSPEKPYIGSSYGTIAVSGSWSFWYVAQ